MCNGLGLNRIWNRFGWCWSRGQDPRSKDARPRPSLGSKSSFFDSSLKSNLLDLNKILIDIKILLSWKGNYNCCYNCKIHK